MIRTGARNLITDVEGISVGQAEDHQACTGVTVLLADAPVAAAVDVRGGAPGSRELDVLDPVNLVGKVDAIALAGGSVFGLEAASGVVAHLCTLGRGFRIAPNAPPIPIVPAAILFDLTNGGDKSWQTPPYAALGKKAAETAGGDFALGNAGAGYGAIAGAYKGGTGSASAVTDDGFTLGALAAVNSVGSPVMPGGGAFWAWPLEMNGEFGGRRPPVDWRAEDFDLPTDMKRARPGANTTIAAIATNVELTRVELKRLAIMAADGFARALRPSHTPFDGDIVFALSTAKRAVCGDRQQAVLRLGAIAADCVARAIARGAHAAATLNGVKSTRDVFPSI
jgi:L-aminopeptidase/D-esterase-like protein